MRIGKNFVPCPEENAEIERIFKDPLKASSNVPFFGEACKDLGKVLLGFILLKYQRWHLLMGEDSVGITEEGVIEHRADSRSTLE